MAHVSTLFRLLGRCQMPLTEVRMYFVLGSLTRPSMAVISADGLAGDESAGSLLNFYFEVKAGAEDIFAQETVFFSLSR